MKIIEAYLRVLHYNRISFKLKFLRCFALVFATPKGKVQLKTRAYWHCSVAWFIHRTFALLHSEMTAAGTMARTMVRGINILLIGFKSGANNKCCRACCSSSNSKTIERQQPTMACQRVVSCCCKLPLSVCVCVCVSNQRVLCKVSACAPASLLQLIVA